MIKKFLTIGLIGLAAGYLNASAPKPPKQAKNIVETAAWQFQNTVAAVKAAGLVDTLASKGPLPLCTH